MSEVIAAYSDDQPFPSCLILGWMRGRPLHVLVVVEAERDRCPVVTAYVPDPALWRQDFKTRRTP
jgi:hypothetical protein